jgi:cytochrome c
MRPMILAAAAAVLSLAACGPSTPPGKSPAELIAELPAPFNMGDFAAGKQVFTQCAACHTIGKDQPNTVGPNLYGVFGRKAGSKADFKYSPGMAAAAWTWDAERISNWITDPRAMITGTKMVFIGVKDPKQRADVIAYLKVATSGGPQ